MARGCHRPASRFRIPGDTAVRYQFRFVLLKIGAEDLFCQGSGRHPSLSSMLDENDNSDFGIVPVSESCEPGVIFQVLAARPLLVFIADNLNGAGFPADILAGNGGIMSRPPVVDALPHSLPDP